MIHQYSYEIKKASKPGNEADNMEGFEKVDSHGFGFGFGLLNRLIVELALKSVFLAKNAKTQRPACRQADSLTCISFIAKQLCIIFLLNKIHKIYFHSF